MAAYDWLYGDYNAGGGGWDSDFELDYDLSSGYDGGNFGGVTYNPADTYTPGSYDLGYDPSYQYTGVKYDTSTNYGGDYGKVSGSMTNTPYWEPAPSYPAPTFNSALNAQQVLGTNPYAMSAGLYGMPAAQTSGGYSATMNLGSGAQTGGGQTLTGPNTTITPTPSSSVAGGLGVTPLKYQLDGNSPSLLESASTTDASKQLSNMAFNRAQENADEGGGFRDWVRDPENRDTVRLGIQGLGVLAGYQAQRDAGKLAKEQMGLQAQNMADQKAAYEREMKLREEALASQREALGRNQQMAQRANQESIQSFDEARSLYNPQEMGIRGMAQQRGTTQRSIADTRKSLAGRGLSPAAIDAEIRRLRLAGATNETSAYMRGLDTGRSAQQSALSSAKALGSTVPGLSYNQGPNTPTFTPNYGGADFYAKQGADNSKALRDLLESYADYPTLRAQEEARLDMQRRSNS